MIPKSGTRFFGKIMIEQTTKRSPKASLAGEPREAFAQPRFGNFGGPRRQIVTFDRRRHLGRRSEKTPCFGRIEAGQARGFEIGGGEIGGLEEPIKVFGALHRKPEAQM